MQTAQTPRVIVIGGGLSATSFAVQLLRRARHPLKITMLEPRKHLGRGLAYSATDPDHRLNAPLDVHWIDPDKPLELREWCEANGVFDSDPGCLTSNGHVFLRRSDLGEYLSSRLQPYMDEGATSGIRHVQATAVSATCEKGIYKVQTDNQGEVVGDMLVVATGNPAPSLRAPFTAEQALDERIISNPLAPGVLSSIPVSARVLVVGSGLTSLDIVSTLVRRNHAGEVLVISRRGFRPRAQSPGVLTAAPRPIVLSTVVPDFLQGVPLSAAAWSRALHKEIRRQAAHGQSWHMTFDAVRDVVWKLWPQLPTPEKIRFLRRLRLFYDVHRFRTPPMNEALVARAEELGAVRYAAATLKRVTTTRSSLSVDLADGASTRSEQFDYVVNCTGLDSAAAWRSNPLLHSMMQSGLLRLHPIGIGFDVDENCQAFQEGRTSEPTLRVIGPPTSGAFGDPLAIPFIANQVHRVMPDVLKTLSLMQIDNYMRKSQVTQAEAASGGSAKVTDSDARA